VGAHEATGLLQAAVSDLEHEQLVPAVHALRTLRYLCDFHLRVDGGATQIAKCRSRHFDAALESGADVWVTLDDDIDADERTLALLLAAVGSDEPRVVFAPYTQRGQDDKVLVTWPPVSVEREVLSVEPAEKGRVRTALFGGFGLVAVNRAAMQGIASMAPSFHDADGKTKCAAFLEYITAEGYWLGEDFAFFERARRVATVEALVEGLVVHAGVPLDLSTLRLA
jgi:hypothetical protein